MLLAWLVEETAGLSLPLPVTVSWGAQGYLIVWGMGLQGGLLAFDPKDVRPENRTEIGVLVRLEMLARIVPVNSGAPVTMRKQVARTLKEEVDRFRDFKRGSARTDSTPGPRFELPGPAAKGLAQPSVARAASTSPPSGGSGPSKRREEDHRPVHPASVGMEPYTSGGDPATTILRVQGAIALVGIAAFFGGYAAAVPVLTFAGGVILVLDDLHSISVGALNPVFPFALAAVLAYVVDPWYVGVLWGSAVFALLDLPGNLLKLLVPARLLPN